MPYGYSLKLLNNFLFEFVLCSWSLMGQWSVPQVCSLNSCAVPCTSLAVFLGRMLSHLLPHFLVPQTLPGPCSSLPPHNYCHRLPLAKFWALMCGQSVLDRHVLLLSGSRAWWWLSPPWDSSARLLLVGDLAGVTLSSILSLSCPGQEIAMPLGVAHLPWLGAVSSR